MNWFAKLFRRRRVRIDSAALSDRGLVRAENQDHVLVGRAVMNDGSKTTFVTNMFCPPSFHPGVV